MANIPVIGWKNGVGNSNVAYLSLDSSIDNLWNINLGGTNSVGNPVAANFVIVDNTGNKGIVYVSFGSARFSVSPYTRKTFQINPDLAFALIEVFNGSVAVVFSDVNPGVPDDTNQYASNNPDAPGTVTLSTFDTTWSLADGNNFKYLNGNYSIGSSGTGTGSVFRGSRTVASKLTSKYYIEFRRTGSGTFGLCNSAFAITNGSPHLDTNTISIFGNLVYVGGTSAGIAVPYVDNTWFKLAIDLINNKLWYSKCGTNDWNGSNANPDIITSGIDIAGVGKLTNGLYLWGAKNVTQVWVTDLNSGQTPFVDGAPSNYAAGW